MSFIYLNEIKKIRYFIKVGLLCFIISNLNADEKADEYTLAVFEETTPILAKLTIIKQCGLIQAIVEFTNKSEKAYIIDTKSFGIDGNNFAKYFFIYKSNVPKLDPVKFEWPQPYAVKPGAGAHENLRLEPDEKVISKFELTEWYRIEEEVPYDIWFRYDLHNNGKIITIKSNVEQFVLSKP